MILSKIPCLDQGFVALVRAHLSSRELEDLAKEFISVDQRYWQKLRQHASLTLVIKCPLLVQLILSRYHFQIASIPHPFNKPRDLFKADEGVVSTGDLQTSKDIAENFNFSAEAMMINALAYVSDGCEPQVAQAITPVCTYTSLIVTGSLIAWQSFIVEQHIGKLAEPYRAAVEQIVRAEWMEQYDGTKIDKKDEEDAGKNEEATETRF